MTRRILLVEDDPTLLEVLATVLDLEEFRVATAPGGAAALAEATAHPPDAVVCDVGMPDIDGVEVCHRLKADPTTAAVPVILLTATPAEADRAAAAEVGCARWLTKPFSALELIDLLREVGVAEVPNGRTEH